MGTRYNGTRNVNQTNQVNHGANLGLNQQVQAYQAPVAQVPVTYSRFEAYTKANDATLTNLQKNLNDFKREQNEFQNEQRNFQKAMMSFMQNNGNNGKSNHASTSGTLPSNTIPNPRNECKGITTRSGCFVLMDLYPLASFLMSIRTMRWAKYQKMLKSLLSNKEKLNEMANTPVSEKCSAIILKKLPEKLEDPGQFLIPCTFSELKCKALADLGASINLMPLSVYTKLGLPALQSTRMTLELANCSLCVPKGIARDVLVPVGRLTFPADFVVVDFECDYREYLLFGGHF
ncbi:reverse transcriptase domain-containing protein [Tanacetum coccineum]